MKRRIQKLTHPAVLVSIFFGAMCGLAIVPANAFCRVDVPNRSWSRLEVAHVLPQDAKDMAVMVIGYASLTGWARIAVVLPWEPVKKRS